MNSAPIPYSAILQDFIEPICSGNETAAKFFEKCQVGQTVWNYYIAVEFSLNIKSEFKNAISGANMRNPEMIPVVDFLMKRKKIFFDMHKVFIVHIEMREREDGPTLYAESMPADKMREFS